MLNVLFMGTPDFARESLESLYNAGYNIIGIVTNPDKPKGRGMKMIASPVKEFGLEKDIPVYQPLRVRNNDSFIDEMKSLNPDVICVVAYGKILPKEILESLSHNSPVVSSSPISTTSFRIISPVSIPISIYIVLIPVCFSPLITAHCIGAAPLYFGSNDPCTFIQPYFGISKISFGSIFP